MPQVTVLRVVSDERQVNRGHAVLALQDAGGVLVLFLLLLLLLLLAVSSFSFVCVPRFRSCSLLF